MQAMAPVPVGCSLMLGRGALIARAGVVDELAFAKPGGCRSLPDGDPAGVNLLVCCWELPASASPPSTDGAPVLSAAAESNVPVAAPPSSSSGMQSGADAVDVLVGGLSLDAAASALSRPGLVLRVVAASFASVGWAVLLSLLPRSPPPPPASLGVFIEDAASLEVPCELGRAEFTLLLLDSSTGAALFRLRSLALMRALRSPIGEVGKRNTETWASAVLVIQASRSTTPSRSPVRENLTCSSEASATGACVLCLYTRSICSFVGLLADRQGTGWLAVGSRCCVRGEGSVEQSSAAQDANGRKSRQVGYKRDTRRHKYFISY